MYRIKELETKLDGLEVPFEVYGSEDRLGLLCVACRLFIAHYPVGGDPTITPEEIAAEANQHVLTEHAATLAAG